MLILRNFSDLGRALASPIDAELKRLLAVRCDQLLEHAGYDLGELAHFIIAQAGDTLDAIEKEAGIPLATSIVDSSPTDNFEWVQRHGGWLEAVVVLTDDGFGLCLFAEDRADTDPALLALLRNHA